METYSIQLAEEGDTFLILCHQHELFKAGKVKQPSFVMAETDTKEMARYILKTLRFWRDKPYGICNGCFTLQDDIYNCTNCSNQ